MTRLDDDASLSQALDALGQAVPQFAKTRALIGDPKLRRWPAGFPTLVDVIVGQQVSNASASAIRQRLRTAFEPLTPDAILAASDDQLRNCGLSRQKIAYLRDLALHVSDGRLDLEHLDGTPDDAAIDSLVAVKGIGPWTAEIYLLFALGRPDVWPSADLGLAVGIRHMFGLDARPTPARMRELAEAWRPWRGAAAHFLWHAYHHFTQTHAIS